MGPNVFVISVRRCWKAMWSMDLDLSTININYLFFDLSTSFKG